MNEWEDNISVYVVFGGQRDYYYDGRLHTDFEEERLREKKGKCFPHYIIGGPEREFFFREIKNEI